MPIRGSDKAPKFDGTAENLLAFIEDYEACADDANLVGGDRIKGIIRYLPNSERALWSGMPEAKLSDYNAFIKEVKEMYPGCEGEKRYAVSDLQSVTRKHAALPMPSLNDQIPRSPPARPLPFCRCRRSRQILDSRNGNSKP